MTTIPIMIPSYQAWNAKLTGRCAAKRKISNNTYLVRQPDGSIALKLHNTFIVTVSLTGMVTLDSGGWRTPTTKGRINDAFRELGFPFGINQVGGVWRVYGTQGHETAGTFADGMQIMPDFSLRGTGPDTKVLLQSVKLIKAYMKPVARMLAEGKFPAPGNGDPWNFMMVATDGTLAMAGSDSETRKHLVDYMRSKYYFGSLLLRAFEKKMGVQHGDTETLSSMVNGTIPRTGWKGFISVSPMCCNAFAHFMNGKPMGGLDTFGGTGAKQLADILEGYLKHWFNIAA